MKKQIRRLPDAELEIMKIIWDADVPVTSAYISEKLKGKKDWKITSILTFLARLTDKGFIECKREGKVNIYSPLITKQEYLEREGKSILEKLYNNSLTNFVASLYSSNAISEEELAELKQYIDELTKEE
jgi:predicted transcriptional regulator